MTTLCRELPLYLGLPRVVELECGEVVRKVDFVRLIGVAFVTLFFNPLF